MYSQTPPPESPRLRPLVAGSVLFLSFEPMEERGEKAPCPRCSERERNMKRGRGKRVQSSEEGIILVDSREKTGIKRML